MKHEDDLYVKHREISIARMSLLLSVLLFLFSFALLLFSYVTEFSDIQENLFTFCCIALFLFFAFKAYKNKNYLKYFFRIDNCHSVFEVILSIVLCFLIFVMFLANFIFLLIASGMKERNKNSFYERLAYVQQMPKEIVSVADSASSEQQFAENLFYEICNVRKAYYINIDDVNSSQFSSHEIKQYNLKNYIKRPTVRGEDGMIYSLVKYTEGCRYVDTKMPYGSDCVLEIDINGFKEPNNYKNDRLIYIIDRYELVPTEMTNKLLRKRGNRK